MKVMQKQMVMMMPAMLLLAGCAPNATDTSSAVRASKAAVAPTSTMPKTQVESPSTMSTKTPAAMSDSASISGAIRDGNRPPPALRVCATPIGGGTPTCIQTADGAREYAIEVAPGSYYLLGWAAAGELTLIAHASQIRCIRAPCPPDELVKVVVAAGQQREGIDLNAGYIDIPDGWPKRPG